MNREPLSNFDAFLVRLDTPTNMAVITGLMIFDKPVEFARLRATMEHRLLEFDRFRQRVGEGGRVLSTPSGNSTRISIWIATCIASACLRQGTLALSKP